MGAFPGSRSRRETASLLHTQHAHRPHAVGNRLQLVLLAVVLLDDEQPRAVRALKKNGMEILYYHFHAFEWIRFESGVRGIDILLGETDPDCVGFQPDVFWLTSAGTEPSESIGMFKGRAAYMHV